MRQRRAVLGWVFLPAGASTAVGCTLGAQGQTAAPAAAPKPAA